VSRSTLHDKEILEATYHGKLNPAGMTQFNYKLPSGRVVVSEWITAEQANSGKVIIRWVDRMREEDSFDKAEEEERQRIAGAKRQTQRSSSDVPTTKDVLVENNTSELPRTSQKDSGGLPDDPDQMIRDKVIALATRLGTLAASSATIIRAIRETEDNFHKWRVVAENLGIDLNPPKSEHSSDTKTDHPSETEKDQPSSTEEEKKEEPLTPGKTKEDQLPLLLGVPTGTPTAVTKKRRRRTKRKPRGKQHVD